MSHARIGWVAPPCMPVLAHLGALLEPLLFLPAFVVVIGAIVRNHFKGGP